ncbi:SDR family NAD(P)-dependent oxidoreductase [Streptomyces sp. NPDC085995]|uniref:SDR family NAD(P)-dependent oxidoreductase n=1 Tax=Streptomyces sp. NPDC085995 TaxID=3154861 RepID=UPI00341F4843
MTTWFITGASRGFGAEIARVALAAGDNVVAAVRDVTRLPEDLAEAERLLPVTLDVTDVHAIPTAVDAAVSQFGDPVKGAALIHEVVSGQDLPRHLYMGRDSIEHREAATRQIEKDLAPWREKSIATARDDTA